MWHWLVKKGWRWGLACIPFGGVPVLIYDDWVARRLLAKHEAALAEAKVARDALDEYALAKPELDLLYASTTARSVDEWRSEFARTNLQQWLDAIRCSNDTVTTHMTLPFNYVSNELASKLFFDCGVKPAVPGALLVVEQLDRWVAAGVLQEDMREKQGEQAFERPPTLRGPLPPVKKTRCFQLTQRGLDLLNKWGRSPAQENRNAQASARAGFEIE